MPEPYYRDDQATVYAGDCIDVMRELDADSVDSVVTDPPYGLEFMGKEWDAPWTQPLSGADSRTATVVTSRSRIEYGRGGSASVAFQEWCTTWAVECLRVLKPGGHMLAFGGTRTWHRLASAIEDAGFEIRDSIAWLYGSGFPKSLDVSKAIDKTAGAEREVVGTQRLTGTAAIDGNQGRAPVGVEDGSSVGATRVIDITTPTTDAAKHWQGWGSALKPAFEPVVVARKPFKGTLAANVQAQGTGALNIDATRVGTSGGGNSCPGGDGCACATNKVLGATKHPVRREGDFGRWPTNVVLDGRTAAAVDRDSGVSVSRRAELTSTPGGIYGGGNGLPSHTGIYGHDDEGGASRFFPIFRYEAKAPTTERPSADGIAHPTVKPLDLMRWLVRLVTPPHGLVLDPFAGSGTTAEACIHEHMRCITIEREADYLPVIVARLNKPMAVGFDFEEGIA